ncbi:MAG: beta-ketoacyl-ACP synthase III [Alphaproteobacteria bacterium]|nr:beta-ketoacyl-ACP synthase III [Alphaproteobacteria bacterium]
MIRSKIIGCGGYLPGEPVTNQTLASWVDTTDDWIVQRTGIRQRHIAADDELTSDLALAAARQALEDAEIDGAEVDAVVLATTTPDQTFPATATRVQSQLGMLNGFAFDVQAVCAGFVYALAVADNFIKAGQAKTVMVIGAETFTRILDWTDRTTCVLFGDGAGAVVLRASEGKGDVTDSGILSTHLHSDGASNDILYVDGGPGSTRTVGHVRMVGKEVFRQAVEKLSEAMMEAIEANDIDASDIDWLIPHQANKRIMDATARKVGVGHNKLVTTVDRHANTSAASIPLALAEASQDGRIQPGNLVLMEAIGGGLSWGSALVRF